VHPNQRFVAPKANTSRNLILGLVVVIIVIGSLIGGLIYLNGHTTSTTTNTGILGTQISYPLYQNLTNVSFSTLAAIGNGGAGVTPPSSITSSPLLNGTKPEILYIGAEFCPYCAAERWPLVIALSKFGNFSNLEYMQSAPNDGNLATLTFVNANYSSKYLSFVTVENEDRNHNLLQSPTGAQNSLWQEFNLNAYPFIDIGGQYDLVTSQFNYNDLSNLNWTQIGSQLNNASSPTTKLIDGAANTLIAAFCSITKQTPSSVCGLKYLSSITVSYTPPSTSFGSESLQMLVLSPTTEDAKVGKFTF
jgi:thiol-disulfide isomerase/thioredoxin